MLYVVLPPDGVPELRREVVQMVASSESTSMDET